MAHECSLRDDHLSTLILTTSTEALKALERQDYVIVTEKREVLDQLTAEAKDVEERCRVALSHVHKIEPVLDVNPNSDEHGEEAAFRKRASTRIAALKKELSLSRRSAIEESNQGLRNSLRSSTGTVYPPTRQGIRGPGLPV